MGTCQLTASMSNLEATVSSPEVTTIKSAFGTYFQSSLAPMNLKESTPKTQNPKLTAHQEMALKIRKKKVALKIMKREKLIAVRM